MIGGVFGVILGAAVGPIMFKFVPLVVDCVLYPDYCIEKTKEEIGYIKGNYTALPNRIFSNKKEANITQEDSVECTGEYISILDYNTTINSTSKAER